MKLNEYPKKLFPETDPEDISQKRKNSMLNGNFRVNSEGELHTKY